LIDRLGVANPIARAADSAGVHTTPMLVALAAAALLALASSVPGRRAAAEDHLRPEHLRFKIAASDPIMERSRACRSSVPQDCGRSVDLE
jgi:hypothetical protein